MGRGVGKERQKKYGKCNVWRFLLLLNVCGWNAAKTFFGLLNFAHQWTHLGALRAHVSANLIWTYPLFYPAVSNRWEMWSLKGLLNTFWFLVEYISLSNIQMMRKAGGRGRILEPHGADCDLPSTCAHPRLALGPLHHWVLLTHSSMRPGTSFNVFLCTNLNISLTALMECPLCLDWKRAGSIV